MKEAMVERLVEAVKGIAGEGYEVKSTVVKKNNGVELDAVNIRTQDDEPDWATAKAVQESILTAFTDAGVNFKFLSDEKLREIEKAIKKKESESWAAKRKKNR